MAAEEQSSRLCDREGRATTADGGGREGGEGVEGIGGARRVEGLKVEDGSRQSEFGGGTRLPKLQPLVGGGCLPGWCSAGR